MAENYIKIRGARVHNLKNIDLDIPKNKLVVITGISGCGKSSLAFDTLYAEGQRRYVESLSAYARQFLGVMDKPDVDSIEGISPAIAIDQRKAAHNPRSTVGTITEIYDYLRLLFARIGKPHCPKCKKEVSRQTIDQIVEQIAAATRFATRPGRVLRVPVTRPGRVINGGEINGGEKEIMILGPVIREKKGEHHGVIEEIQRGGFVRIRIDGIIYRVEEALERTLARSKKHNIEVVVDRLVLDKNLDRSRLVDSLETALKLGKGIVIVNCKLKIENLKTKSEDLVFSEHFACEECGISLPELEPRLFSFNSPYGACPACQGLGEKLEVDPKLVIPNPNLSIAEGAIFPWAHASHKIGRQGFFWWQITDLAEKYNFSLDIPAKELPKNIINLILYGEKPNTGYNTQDTKYEGVIPGLERRYHETDSEYTREEIERYMVEKKCEACQGKRLKPEVLAVTIANKSIDEIVETPISKLPKELSSFKKELSSFEVSQPIIKEIINRLHSKDRKKFRTQHTLAKQKNKITFLSFQKQGFTHHDTLKNLTIIFKIIYFLLKNIFDCRQ